MRRLPNITAVMMVVFWMASSAQAVGRSEVLEQTATKGIFREAPDGPTEAGKVDLVIKFSLKTHLPGHFLLDSEKCPEGKPGYPFIVTIDGQSVVWREDGEIEKTPLYDAKGIRTPEGGDGRRYVLEKRLRLTPGTHRIEIELPEESSAYRANVTLEERGAPYLLEFRPVYRRSGKQRPSFLNGLGQLKPYLDGVDLKGKTR